MKTSAPPLETLTAWVAGLIGGSSHLGGTFLSELAPRTALVTGGSRGIGRAVSASAPPERGSRSTTDPTRPPPGLVNAIRAAGGEAMALAGDVADPAESRQLVRDVVTAWGRLDIVVNNAGHLGGGPCGRG